MKAEVLWKGESICSYTFRFSFLKSPFQILCDVGHMKKLAYLCVWWTRVGKLGILRLVAIRGGHYLGIPEMPEFVLLIWSPKF